MKAIWNVYIYLTKIRYLVKFKEKFQIDKMNLGIMVFGALESLRGLRRALT